MTPIWWGTLGIIANMVGVLMLFGFGAPFRIPTGGVDVLAIGEGSIRAKWIDRIFAFLSWFGLFAVLVGNLLQIYAIWIA